MNFWAGCYDELTYDVAYTAWADYIQRTSAGGSRARPS